MTFLEAELREELFSNPEYLEMLEAQEPNLPGGFQVPEETMMCFDEDVPF